MENLSTVELGVWIGATAQLVGAIIVSLVSILIWWKTVSSQQAERKTEVIIIREKHRKAALLTLLTVLQRLQNASIELTHRQAEFDEALEENDASGAAIEREHFLYRIRLTAIDARLTDTELFRITGGAVDALESAELEMLGIVANTTDRAQTALDLLIETSRTPYSVDRIGNSLYTAQERIGEAQAATQKLAARISEP